MMKAIYTPAILICCLLLSPAVRAQPETVEMEGTSIIGNRELPKVLYIVPWKKPAPGELVAQPVKSIYESMMVPLDRDVFRRQLKYFRGFNDSRE